ncbi:hypothetical protein G9A89_007421 [Geosiphon pyriformis]|nr:hypothetical protein G9A89_007421 [Geosiphon pyriformis]
MSSVWNPKESKFGERLVHKIYLDDQDLLSDLRYYAKFANRAYCLKEEDRIHEEIFVKTYHLDNSHEIYVIMKASELSIIQWETRKNQMVKYKPAKFAMVDKYFYTEFLRWKDKLMGKLDSLLTKNSSLTISAHGIGGVYAIFLGLYCKERGYTSDIKIYTYGQPRIGDAFFAQYVNNNIKKLFRVTRFDDYVSQRPKRINLYGYMHHQTEIWINSCDCKDVVLVCPGIKSAQYDFIEENYDCNAAFQVSENEIPNLESHYGLYFGVKMGECGEDDLIF